MSSGSQSSVPFTIHHSGYENPELITHFWIWSSRSLNEIWKWPSEFRNSECIKMTSEY